MMKHKENELISIVIPVYNVQDYLNKCYESIKSQTYTNLEIIFVDDGATDKSGEMCDKFATNDNRVKVFHMENRGVSAARNYGVEQCGGEYIMFMDSDDYLSPYCVECLYEMIKKDGTRYAIGGVEKIGVNQIPKFMVPDQNKHEVIKAEEAIIRLMYRKGINTYPCSKLYKKDLVDSLKFREKKLCEDIPFTYEVLKKVEKVSYIGCNLYYYVQRSGSYMHSCFNDNTMDGIKFSKEIMESNVHNRIMYKATASKYFFVLMDVLIRVDKEHMHVRNEIVQEIKSVRRMVLMDSGNKLSQRLMAGFTFGPTNFYVNIAKLYKKFENRKYR